MAILFAATALLVAGHISAEPSAVAQPGVNLANAAVTPSSKGTESESGVYIHPVLQDNGAGNGDKALKNGLNQPQQEDYHQSQGN